MSDDYDSHSRTGLRTARIRRISQRPSEVHDTAEKYNAKIKVITARCGHAVEHPKFIAPTGDCWACHAQGAK